MQTFAASEWMTSFHRPPYFLNPLMREPTPVPLSPMNMTNFFFVEGLSIKAR
jgi:hypothetical protein